jgi:hypothetical protein
VRRMLIAPALLLATLLVSASVAYGALVSYRGPLYWSCYCDGSSSYAASWRENYFDKSTSGVSDTAVTFIDNGVFGYGWHGTVRNTSAHQRAYWDTGYVKKAYCKFYSGTAFTGVCAVYGR